jgi:hypothetical protein
MVQFYALSVVVNLVSGLVLAVGEAEKKPTILTKLRDLFGTKAAKFSLGLLAVIIGLFKILTPTAGDVVVVGDILPALSGFALGGILLLDFFRASSDSEPSKLTSVILSNKRFVGIAGLVIGILHFLMPGVPII